MVTVVREVRREEEEVEMVVEDAVEKEKKKKADGAVGLMGSPDLRTVEVKADRKA